MTNFNEVLLWSELLIYVIVAARLGYCIISMNYSVTEVMVKIGSIPLSDDIKVKSVKTFFNWLDKNKIQYNIHKTKVIN